MPPSAVPTGGDLPADAHPQVAPSRRTLVQSVVAAFIDGRDVVRLAGQHGVGKTTLLDAVAVELKTDEFLIVRVDGTRCGRDELHRLMAAALGAPPDKALESLDLLQALLDQRYRMELIILFDDADALPAAMFRYLRVLLDVFNRLEPNLHLVLAGAAGAWDGLRQLDAETFEKIAPAPLVIEALTDGEAEAYLRQRIASQPGGPRRASMTGSRSRSILKTAQGNPAAIDAAVAQWRRPAGFTSAEMDAPAHRMPVSARVGAAAVLSLMAAVAIPVQAPPFEDTISGRTKSQPVVRTATASAEIGRVDTFSAAIATARNDVSPSVPPRGVAVRPQRPEPAQEASSAAPHQSVEGPSVARTPDPPAPATMPAASTLAQASSSGPSDSPVAKPEVTFPVVPDPAPSDSVRLALAQPGRAGASVASNPPPMPKPSDRPTSAVLPGSRTFGGPGLVLIARRGDTLDALYARVYRGLTPPPYEVVVAANPKRIVPGTIVVFPTPAEGWSRQ